MVPAKEKGDYKAMIPTEQEMAIAVIEDIVSDDWAEDISCKSVFRGRVTKKDYRIAADKLGDIYMILHGINKEHGCYQFHSEWRQSLKDKYDALVSSL